MGKKKTDDPGPVDVVLDDSAFGQGEAYEGPAEFAEAAEAAGMPREAIHSMLAGRERGPKVTTPYDNPEAFAEAARKAGLAPEVIDQILAARSKGELVTSPELDAWRVDDVLREIESRELARIAREAEAERDRAESAGHMYRVLRIGESPVYWTSSKTAAVQHMRTLNATGLMPLYQIFDENNQAVLP